MPRLKKIEGKIPSIYRIKAIDLILYGWVESKRKYAEDWEFPFFIDKAIDEFLAFFEIPEDDYSRDSAHVIYWETRQKIMNI